MTNYNDGKWHGWDVGECPVHEKSEVRVVFYNGDTTWTHYLFEVGDLPWNISGNPIVAFRVVKEYKEPREFWIRGDLAFDSKVDAETWGLSDFQIIHVREVLE